MRFIGWLGSPADHNTYLSWMRQAAEGYFFFEDRFTTEPHDRIFIRPVWLILGKASALTTIPLILTYHIFRILSGLVLLYASYTFISIFIKSKLIKRAAFLLIGTSAGFGWIFALYSFFSNSGLPYYSLDLYAPEAITFRTIHQHTHFSIAVVLILVTLMLAWRSFQTGGKGWAMGAGISCFFLGFIHPFDVATVYLTLFLYLSSLYLREKKLPVEQLKTFLIMILTSCFPIGYNFYLLISNPVFQGWTEQNVVPSPNLIAFLLGYGSISILASIGLGYIITRRKDKDYFLISLVLSYIILIFSPIRFSLRFVEGFHVPLSILASIGLFLFLKHSQRWFKEKKGFKKVRYYALVLFLVSAMPTNIAVLVNDMFFHVHADPFPSYLHEDEFRAFKWLEDNTHPSEVVLSSYETGNFIPGWSGNKVFIGHWAETLNRASKEKILRRFFDSSTDDAVRIDILKTYNIKYILYGKNERLLGGFKPGDNAYLYLVYENPSVLIFKVLPQIF